MKCWKKLRSCRKKFRQKDFILKHRYFSIPYSKRKERKVLLQITTPNYGRKGVSLSKGKPLIDYFKLNHFRKSQLRPGLSVALFNWWLSGVEATN